MKQIEVTTQTQLDKALKNQRPGEVIVCLGGTVWKPLIVTGSSSVVARGSSRVVARESSRVVARESSRVEAWGSSRVVASKFVAIHRHNKAATVKGGVLIDVPDPSSLSPTEWCDYYGVKVVRDTAYVFKAVDDDLSTPRARQRGIFYTPGTNPTCDDFNERPECGGGLHASPSPSMALDYNREATRFVCCPVKLTEIVVIDNKVKVPRIAGKVFEVDRHGDKLQVAEAA